MALEVYQGLASSRAGPGFSERRSVAPGERLRDSGLTPVIAWVGPNP